MTLIMESTRLMLSEPLIAVSNCIWPHLFTTDRESLTYEAERSVFELAWAAAILMLACENSGPYATSADQAAEYDDQAYERCLWATYRLRNQIAEYIGHVNAERLLSDVARDLIDSGCLNVDFGIEIPNRHFIYDVAMAKRGHDLYVGDGSNIHQIVHSDLF